MEQVAESFVYIRKLRILHYSYENLICNLSDSISDVYRPILRYMYMPEVNKGLLRKHYLLIYLFITRCRHPGDGELIIQIN